MKRTVSGTYHPASCREGRLTLGPFKDVGDFLAQLTVGASDATAIGVVVIKGAVVTSHQINMTTEDLLIASELFRIYD